MLEARTSFTCASGASRLHRVAVDGAQLDSS